MPYLFVLPVFLVWLTAGLAVLLALRIKAPGWPGRPYVAHAFWGSSAGVFLANGLLVAALALVASVMPAAVEGEGSVQTTLRLAWAAAALLGPFFVSAGGWFLGLVAGLVIANLRISKSAN